MKIKALAVLAGVGAPLILAAPATADLIDIYTTMTQPDGLDVRVHRVFLVFDNPGEDRMIAVAGTADGPMQIQVMFGDFYQHQFGTDRPPADFWIEAFPSIAYDTFLTIGVQCVGDLPGCQPQDNMLIAPGFPGFRSNILSTDNSGWIVPLNEPQGDPFDPIHCFPGDGRILIGQFSTIGGEVTGWMVLQYLGDGIVQQAYVNFYSDDICSSAIECDDFDPCNGIEQCNINTDTCFPSPPSPDCNTNGVLDSCDIDQATSQDGNGNGVPDECECTGDLDGDGGVGILDFLFLLASWGPCSDPCPPACVADIAAADCTVGIDDFLAMLGNWGDCSAATPLPPEAQWSPGGWSAGRAPRIMPGG